MISQRIINFILQIQKKSLETLSSWWLLWFCIDVGVFMLAVIIYALIAMTTMFKYFLT